MSLKDKHLTSTYCVLLCLIQLDISIKYSKPIGNGIITALNLSQAMKRSNKDSFKKRNKGSEAANAVIDILKNGPKKI